jgi:hypothetical protein
MCSIMVDDLPQQWNQPRASLQQMETHSVRSAVASYNVPWRSGNKSRLLLKLFGGLEYFLFFPYIGNNNRNWLSYLLVGLKPPTR